jgi:hypothetical protein
MTVHVEESIERYFEGRIGRGEDRDALFGHLDRCMPCRSHFDRVAFTHRALFSGDGSVPRAELDLIKGTLISGSKRPWTIRFSMAAIVGTLAPAAAVIIAAFAFFVLPRNEGVFTAKGGAVARAGAIEVLCFDDKKEVTAHLKEDGACVAPGFVKVIYASPETMPSLVVAAVEDDEVRFVVELKSPKPRSVVPEFAELRPGSAIRVIAFGADKAPDKDEIARMKPRLVVEGVSK